MFRVKEELLVPISNTLITTIEINMQVIICLDSPLKLICIHLLRFETKRCSFILTRLFFVSYIGNLLVISSTSRKIVRGNDHACNSKAYLEPSQTSTMELFCEDKRCVDGYNLLSIFVKSSIEDVRLVYEYVSAADGVSLVSKEISFFFRDVVENLHPR